MAGVEGVPLRRDAERNRAKVLAAAREVVSTGKQLGLNDIARRADVGVGTVYRHFGTVERLREALVTETLESLSLLGRECLHMSDTGLALTTFLREAMAAQMRDDAIEAVVAAEGTADQRTAQIKEELTGIFETLLSASIAAGAMRDDLSPEDLVVLLCGTAHSARISPSSTDPKTVERYLDILFAGIRTQKH